MNKKEMYLEITAMVFENNFYLRAKIDTLEIRRNKDRFELQISIPIQQARGDIVIYNKNI